MDKFTKLVVKTLEDHKASDISVIDVKEKTPFADYYVLATASNNRQLNALADAVEEALEKAKFSIGHIEGKAESGWILIDAHHIIVNIFSAQERERISLDELLNRK